MNNSITKIPGPTWNGLYKIGGTAALFCAAMYLVALGVYLPAYRVSPPPSTVLQWFTLFQSNPLTGLFFLGLADMIITILWAPMSLALYTILKQTNRAWAMVAVFFVFVGMAVFLATNTAAAMFYLSRQYAAATTEAQRSSLLSAGQAMLAIAEGTRMLPLMWIAGLILSSVMLRSEMFSKVTAWAGIVGLGLLSLSALFAGYATTGPTTVLTTIMVAVTYGGGGLLSFVWYIFVGLRLLRLENQIERAVPLPAQTGSV